MDDSGDPRWEASFAADLRSKSTVTFWPGILLLRREALRLVLLNADGWTVDARSLRKGAAVFDGAVIGFPCHLARVDRRIPPPCKTKGAPGSSTSGDGPWPHAATRCVPPGATAGMRGLGPRMAHRHEDPIAAAE